MLRAKRAVEQNERNAREKERKEAEQRVKIFTCLFFAYVLLLNRNNGALSWWMRVSSSSMRRSSDYKSKPRTIAMSSSVSFKHRNLSERSSWSCCKNARLRWRNTQSSWESKSHWTKKIRNKDSAANSRKARRLPTDSSNRRRCLRISNCRNLTS